MLIFSLEQIDLLQMNILYLEKNNRENFLSYISKFKREILIREIKPEKT